MFKNGKYFDRYYQGLIQHLPDDQKKNIFFVPTILVRKKLKNIFKISNKADEQFLYKFDFLHFTDYLRALLSPFLIKKIDLNNFTFRGLNVAPVLKDDFKKNIANSSSFSGILNYLFFKRLKQSNIKLRFVVNWFENQVIDRGFNKGKNDFYPNVPSIGYQGFIVSYDYNFYLQPTELEYTAKILPDKIAVIGKGLIKNVKKYCSQLQIIAAPAFRFNTIHENGIKTGTGYAKKKILVALPISVNDSIDIMKLVILSKKDSSINQNKFIIKPHPALNIEKVKTVFKSWPDDFDYCNKNFSEIILKSDLMIGNTSSTCMESLAYGVPVAVVGSQRGFTQNPIPESIPKSIWCLCYTGEELISAINRLCRESNDLNKEHSKNSISRQIRHDYFETVNRKSVSNFLNL